MLAMPLWRGTKLVAVSATYTSCVNGVGFHWVCTPAAPPTVLAADELRVIATS
jgi:hypothetical protein